MRLSLFTRIQSKTNQQLYSLRCNYIKCSLRIFEVGLFQFLEIRFRNLYTVSMVVHTFTYKTFFHLFLQQDRFRYRHRRLTRSLRTLHSRLVTHSLIFFHDVVVIYVRQESASRGRRVARSNDSILQRVACECALCALAS